MVKFITITNSTVQLTLNNGTSSFSENKSPYPSPSLLIG